MYIIVLLTEASLVWRTEKAHHGKADKEVEVKYSANNTLWYEL